MDGLLERLHPRWFRDVARMTLERPSFEWVDSGGMLDAPDSFGEGIEGAVDRYVAMTRATQQLIVLS